MKKLLVILLAALMAVSAFTACGDKEEEGKTESTASKADESVSTPVADEPESDDIEAEASEGKTEENSADATEGGALSVDALKSATGDMMADPYIELPAEDVYNDTGINPETFAEGFWICENTGNSAETVAFYIANSEAEGEAIRGLLAGKLASLQNQYKDYNADNYSMTLDAETGGSGVYAYLVISPNKAGIVDAVKAAIEG